MCGKAGLNFSSEDELQLVEGLSLMVRVPPPDCFVPFARCSLHTNSNTFSGALASSFPSFFLAHVYY
ncbi:hypothetical protein M758_2G198600 [Ceratodon purpureus]|uniref:Uncharacterized protein n=1 Tax=Ceratodon purpureus TaxID=3225 RepID=A0A8T0IYY9_CERPU|nr:hypothetical protein KC19_2G244400 [Ceratodon purpureus]KAG0627405.1 hypothetical protein M758_2G198600 [Ceratodon purpureus]